MGLASTNAAARDCCRTSIGRMERSRGPQVGANNRRALHRRVHPLPPMPSCPNRNPPPVPVTGIAGTCRNVLPERCDSVRLNVFQ